MILFAICLFSCQQKKTNKLTLATAASMQFVMKELTETFSKKTGIDCETILGSSGKLTAQLLSGAPYDLFISADMKYPQALYTQGMTKATPEVFATGRLVLWTMEDGKLTFPANFDNTDYTHIAMANPKTAPYGIAAMETLQSLGIYQQLESKLVYGESIAQTNQFITSEAAQIGFTAKSVVIAPGLKDKGTWIEIPSGYHSPLEHGVVMLKDADKPGSEASLFYDFLFSAEAKEILNKFGYYSPSE